MSDFSELCPLFTTGVYSELSVLTVGFTGLSSTMNALKGAVIKATKPGSLKFQRTVIVTKVFAHRVGNPATGVILLAKRHLSTGTAAGTAFASIKMSSTATVAPKGCIKKMTQAANKTFLAADVLGFANKTKKTDGGKFAFIVRYKEK
jgi:hypothetical protein